MIFSANFAPEQYQTDYIFCSNATRYEALENKKGDRGILVTSNLADVCDEKMLVNYSDLCFDEKGKCDNSVIMLLKLLLKLEIREVYVAGFDGYRTEGDNYIASYMINQHTKGQEVNRRNKRYVADIRKQMKIVFLTDSVYEEKD